MGLNGGEQMKHQVLTLILLFLTSACGVVEKMPGASIDSRLEKIYFRFLDDAATRGVVIPQKDQDRLIIMKFDNDMEFKKDADLANGSSDSNDKDVLGICRQGQQINSANLKKPVTWTEIHILDPRFSRYGKYDPDSPYDLTLTRIMYHELGHCLLHKGHSTTGGVDVMEADLAPVSDSTGNFWEFSVDQLFSPSYLAGLPGWNQ